MWALIEGAFSFIIGSPLVVCITILGILLWASKTIRDGFQTRCGVCILITWTLCRKLKKKILMQESDRPTRSERRRKATELRAAKELIARAQKNDTNASST